VQLVCRQLKVVTNKIVACHHPALAGWFVDGSAAAERWVRVVNAAVTNVTNVAAAAAAAVEVGQEKNDRSSLMPVQPPKAGCV
jgi:hypothetical protein